MLVKYDKYKYWIIPWIMAWLIVIFSFIPMMLDGIARYIELNPDIEGTQEYYVLKIAPTWVTIHLLIISVGLVIYGWINLTKKREVAQNTVEGE